MLRRRRTARKLVRVARMLQELDAAAHPSARSDRRPSRIALGRAA